MSYTATERLYLGADGKASNDPESGALFLESGAVISDEVAVSVGLPVKTLGVIAPEVLPEGPTAITITRREKAQIKPAKKPEDK